MAWGEILGIVGILAYIIFAISIPFWENPEWYDRKEQANEGQDEEGT